jgi:energy-coupling factor transport system ATP-binding protein
LLDEPLAGLDDAARARVLELVAELVRAHGASVLVATHQPEWIGALATGAVRVTAGRVTADEAS